MAKADKFIRLSCSTFYVVYFLSQLQPWSSKNLKVALWTFSRTCRYIARQSASRRPRPRGQSPTDHL